MLSFWRFWVVLQIFAMHPTVPLLPRRSLSIVVVSSASFSAEFCAIDGGKSEQGNARDFALRALSRQTDTNAGIQEADRYARTYNEMLRYRTSRSNKIAKYKQCPIVPNLALLTDSLRTYSSKLATVPMIPNPIATTSFSLPLLADAAVGRALSVDDERLALALDAVETIVTILLDVETAELVGKAERLEAMGEAATAVVTAGAGAADVVGAGAGAGEAAGAGLRKEKSD